MDHVMVDLETLGTNQDSAFISIGACRFDPSTGKIGETFSKNIDWDSALKGRGVTGGTIKWWMRQSPEAQNKVCAPGEPLKNVLVAFGSWFRAGGVERQIWGNGATFDVAMLENAYTAIFGMLPWKHWNVRDVRTIVELAIGRVAKESSPFEGIKHRAVDDAIHQATYVSAMWQALRGTR